MRITLINPPLGSLSQPFLALPSLQGHLRHHGYQDITIRDASQTILDRMLRGEYLRRVTTKLEEVVSRLESQSELELFDAMRLEGSLMGLAAARAAAQRIDEAVATLRDKVRFYDVAAHASAQHVVDLALEAISSLHFPQKLTQRNYIASRIRDLDTEDEFRQFVETPGACLFHAEYLNEIVDEIAAGRPELIGLSATFQDQFLPAMVLAHLLRRRLPEAYLVMGGAFTSSVEPVILARPWLFDYVDSFILFEGEGALLSLVRALETGEDLGTAPNLYRRENGRVRPPSLPRRREPMDQLALPDYRGYDVTKYLVPGWDVLYDPTRGCYWNKCTFCTVSMSTKGSDRTRPALRIVDDMERLCEIHDTNVVSFAVDAIPVPLMRAVCEEILRRRLDVGWSSEFILDKLLDRETIRLFAEAGCLLLLFGLESANARIIRLMKKGTVPERSARIIRECSEAGIHVLLHVLMGYPTETEEELEETLRFIEEISDYVDLYELNAFHLDEGAPVIFELASLGITSSYPLKRAFNVDSVKPYRTSHGISAVRAAELLDPVRERLDRAIGLAGRSHLRDDGAHLHLYLKNIGKRPRDLDAEGLWGAEAKGVLASHVQPVQSRFDLGAINGRLQELHDEWNRQQRSTGAGGAEIWRSLGDLKFRPGRGFHGLVDARFKRFVALDPTTHEIISMLSSDDELAARIEMMGAGRSRVVSGLLNVLAEHGLANRSIGMTA